MTLSRKDISVKAAKILERMTRLCCIGPDECTAMDKLSKWFKEGSWKLMDVLNKFEFYQNI